MITLETKSEAPRRLQDRGQEEEDMNTNASTSTAFGRTLGALRGLGVRSFPTAHGALADAMGRVAA